MTQTEAQEQAIQELGTLKKEIVDIIERVYSCCFVGKLEVIPLPRVGWLVKFGLPNIEKPISLAAELSHDDFLKYIEEELRYGSWNSELNYSLELQYVDLPMDMNFNPLINHGKK